MMLAGRRWLSSLMSICRLAVVAALVAMPSAIAAQGDFPFDREMLLDARPLKGSRRVPVLEVDANGRAQIDLWCKRGEGQVTVNGDAMTITVGAMTDGACTPEREQGDAQMLAALAQVTSWTQQGDMVVLVGPTTLRFHLATN